MSSIVCYQILVPNTGLHIFPFSLYAAVNKVATKKGIFGGKKSKRGKIENSLSLFPLFLIRHTLNSVETGRNEIKATKKCAQQKNSVRHSRYMYELAADLSRKFSLHRKPRPG